MSKPKIQVLLSNTERVETFRNFEEAIIYIEKVLDFKIKKPERAKKDFELDGCFGFKRRNITAMMELIDE